MFHKVIVGIDVSEVAAASDVITSTKAIARGAELILVSVFPLATAGEGDELTERGMKLRTESLRVLEVLRNGTGATGAELVAVGDLSPGRTLRLLADERQADLLVVGSARHTGIGRVFLGDESRAALRGAPCPALVLPLGHRLHQTPATIGVAFDRSPGAFVALQEAVRYARAVRAKLTIVEAVETRAVPKVRGVPEVAVYEDTRRGVEQALRQLAANLNVPTEVEATVGARSEVLGELAERVDMMVCGSHGWGPAAKVSLGSTGDWLTHHVRCPVLIIPSAEDSEASGDLTNQRAAHA
jgi:nucleotide-binding universal stress UspA family protein